MQTLHSFEPRNWSKLSPILKHKSSTNVCFMTYSECFWYDIVGILSHDRITTIWLVMLTAKFRATRMSEFRCEYTKWTTISRNQDSWSSWWEIESIIKVKRIFRTWHLMRSRNCTTSTKSSSIEDRRPHNFNHKACHDVTRDTIDTRVITVLSLVYFPATLISQSVTKLDVTRSDIANDPFTNPYPSVGLKNITKTTPNLRRFTLFHTVL